MGASRSENAAEFSQEFVVGRVIRPKSEDSARTQVRSEGTQTIRFIKRSVARMQQVAGRMIDIQQHRMKLPARPFRIESPLRLCAGKEICVHHFGPAVARQPPS